MEGVLDMNASEKEVLTGIKNVSPNNYRVDIDLIVEEKTSEDHEKKGMTFHNPRYLSETFDNSAIGCSVSEMDSLKSSIQEHGLFMPLIGRIKQNKVSLINGHRRFRAIQELVKDNDLCYDPSTGKNVPASELYKEIDIKIFNNVNEMDCYMLAFAEDKSKVKFGAGIEYKFVQYCVENKIEDNDIVKMTGNNQKWLDGVKTLIKKLENDYEILDALFSNKMNLSAAKKIAEHDDQGKRMSVFKEALVIADGETAQKKQKQERSLNSTKKKLQSAIAEKVIASHMGDEDAEKSADDLIESYRKQEEAQNETLKNIETRVTGRTVAAAQTDKPKEKKEKKPKKESISGNKDEQKTVSIDEGNVSISDIVSNWVHPLDQMLEEENISGNKLIIDFAKDLVEAVMDKSSSCSEFMNRWLTIFEDKGMVA